MRIQQSIHHRSGIQLGGIGTGSVEIWPDGLFHEWQVNNTGPWNTSDATKPNTQPEDSDRLIFLVRTKDHAGRTTVRYLALEERLHDLYSHSWLKSVQGIQFDGRFPLAILQYQDEALPVEITADIYSPFVPLVSQLSATPGFYISFHAQNLTTFPVEVSIACLLRNFAGEGQESRKARNILLKQDAFTTITLGADGLEPDNPTTGQLAVGVSGGDISWVTGAYTAERPGCVLYKSSRYGLKVYSYLRLLRDTGYLPNTTAQTEFSFPEGFQASAVSRDTAREYLSQLLQHSLFHDKLGRLREAEPKLTDDAESLNEFLDDAAANLTEMQDRGPWGDACLASSATIAAGERFQPLFALGWYFPNHISPGGPNIGHRYEHWFQDAASVVRYLFQNHPGVEQQVAAFTQAMYGSSLPEEAVDAITSQLGTLIKCSWWTKDGNFGIWEGLGCCGFHTTDITYQGSFPIISLFPDLQKNQMLHGARFQREDGRVHHFFTPDFSAVDDGFDRVDMNPQFVLLAARDYFWTGDRAYLEALWPHILRAMDNSLLLDTDGDALPDIETRRNTYDVWDFEGTPAYICSLWLGSLAAGVHLAEAMGDTERQAQWAGLLEKGRASMESKLWNGSYYLLWKDTDRQDECCMIDQMSADWFLACLGWEPVCRPERIQQALSSILKYCFRPDEGLINAAYPPGTPRKLSTTGNLQADATWTGIEYTVAALMLSQGMIDEGMAVVRDIHNRHLQAGRFWNHHECGSHYYRAMSSWTVLLGWTGFCWDCISGEMAFCPAIPQDDFSYPWFTSTAWGVLEATPSGACLEVLGGVVNVKSLDVTGLLNVQAVLLNEAEILWMNDGGTIRIHEGVELSAGDIMDIFAQS